MKRFKFVWVLLLMLVNLLIISPAYAEPEKPKFATNPDYIEITQTLNSLKTDPTQAANYTPEELQKKISELEFQKYTLETGTNWGQCRNETGKTLAVYGQKPKKSQITYENVLYFLADGQTTNEKWDCDGVYLPSDAKTSGLTADGQDLGVPVALKIVDGTQLVIKTNPETAALEFSVPPAKIFKVGETNWFIPDVAQSVIETKVPNAPTLEND